MYRIFECKPGYWMPVLACWMAFCCAVNEPTYPNRQAAQVACDGLNREGQ